MTNNPKLPSYARLKTLNNFLTNVCDPAHSFNLTRTHGFLCGMETVPCGLAPKNYIPILYGSDNDRPDPIKNYPLEYLEEATAIIEEITGDIRYRLNKERLFFPLLWDNKTNNRISYKTATLELLGYWCDGYLEAATLDPIWKNASEENKLLLPFAVLSGAFTLIGKYDEKNKPITDDLPYKIQTKTLLPAHIASLYNFWSEGRKNPIALYNKLYGNTPLIKTRNKTNLSPISWQEPRDVRERTCLCGSGRQYDECCGASNRILN